MWSSQCVALAATSSPKCAPKCPSSWSTGIQEAASPSAYGWCAISEWNEAEAIRDDRFPRRRIAHRACYVMGAPYSHDFSKSRAAVLGVPFDCGAHPFRIGSRQGPTAIRGQSILVRRYNAELAAFDPAHRLVLLDPGDVRLTPIRITDAFARI